MIFAFLGAVALCAIVIVTFLGVSNRTSGQALASVNSTEPAEQVVDLESELASSAAISIAPAPTTTTSTPTTSTTTTSTTSSSTSTTTTTTTSVPTPPSLPLTGPDLAALPTECRGARYEVQIPIGWFAQNCAAFSEGPFPEQGVIGEFRPEIEVAFTTDETYPEAIARIEADETVLVASPASVNGQAARRYVVRDEWFEVGERTVVIVDAGDGVFSATANQLVAINAPQQLGIDARYARTLATLDELLADLAVDAAQNQTCVEPAFSNPQIVSFGRADFDGDGDTERVRLISHDAGRAITVDGLGPGTIWGSIPTGSSDSRDLGWADWDRNSAPEILFGLDRPDLDVAHGVLTVQNCALITVVTSDGQALELSSTGTAGGAVGYACVRDEVLGFALQSSQTLVGDGQTDIVHTVTRYSYGDGVVRLDGQRETETRLDFGIGGGFDSCVERRF